QLVLAQPDDDLAVEHADRRRHRARRAHLSLRLEPDLDALAGREAVRDERRLECDDRCALAHLVRHADHGIDPTVATQRAAASSPRRAAASSAPPRRKPAASASPAPFVSTSSAATGAKSIRASSVTKVTPRGPRLITPVGAVR